MRSRVLVASPSWDPDSSLERELFAQGDQFVVHRSPNRANALSEVAAGGYSAVVCCADCPEDLCSIAEIRQTSQGVPILVISAATDPAFSDQAAQAGATIYVPSERAQAAVVEYLLYFRKMEQATQSLSGNLLRARMLSEKVQELLAARRSLLADSASLTRGQRFSRLLPLLVEDDAEYAFQLVRAFEKAEVFAPLPILRSMEEAIAYLDGRSPYSDRGRYPLPNIVLLDLHNPVESGLEVIGWIRSQIRFSRTPIIVLGDAIDGEALKRADSYKVNSYLLKPENLEELVEMVRAIDLYWSKINVGQELF